MAQVVIDKSFLYHKGPSEVAKLCEQTVVVMPDSLFYELITTDKDSLQRCFERLPNRRNPVMLVALGLLLHYEMEKGHPYGGLAEHAINEDYVINVGLREGTFVFKEKIDEARKQWQDRVKKETQNFIGRCLCVHEFFPELNGISWSDFPGAIAKARRKVAEDHDFVGDICARHVELDNGVKPTRFDANWAWFRMFQCQLLGALRLFGKWQGKYPKNVGEKFHTKTEHSMLDVDYVVIGALAGGIATFDEQIREDFLMVCPQGELIPSVVEVAK
jgi:hypothetical protein